MAYGWDNDRWGYGGAGFDDDDDEEEHMFLRNRGRRNRGRPREEMRAAHHVAPVPTTSRDIQCDGGDIVMEKVDHAGQQSDGMGAILASGDFSDVEFVVNDVTFRAHKAILAAGSNYFRLVNMKKDNRIVFN